MLCRVNEDEWVIMKSFDKSWTLEWVAISFSKLRQWVSQKVHLDFSVISYGKTQKTFLANPV